MTTELITQSASVVIAHTPANEALIRDQFGLADATTLEIEYFFAVAQRMGLDPIRKQIYAIMRNDRQLGRKKLTIQVGIDGYRSTAHGTKEFAGADDAVFEGDNGKNGPAKATVTVYRFVQGVRCAFPASARWNEYAQTTGQWPSKPYVMLAKCAEALALRKAFPNELGGTYTPDEMPVLDGDATESLKLNDEQRDHLIALLLQAGVSQQVAERKVASTTAAEYPNAVAAMGQRIAERAQAAAEKAAQDDAVTAEVVEVIDADEPANVEVAS